MELPNAATGTVAKHVSAVYYEAIPPTKIYRTYPVHHPDRTAETVVLAKAPRKLADCRSIPVPTAPGISETSYDPAQASRRLP
jgi:hypothetical protein